MFGTFSHNYTKIAFQAFLRWNWMPISCQLAGN